MITSKITAKALKIYFSLQQACINLLTKLRLQDVQIQFCTMI